MPAAAVYVLGWNRKAHTGAKKVRVAITANCNSPENIYVDDFRMEVGWRDVMAQMTVHSPCICRKRRGGCIKQIY